MTSRGRPDCQGCAIGRESEGLDRTCPDLGGFSFESLDRFLGRSQHGVSLGGGGLGGEEALGGPGAILDREIAGSLGVSQVALGGDQFVLGLGGFFGGLLGRPLGRAQSRILGSLKSGYKGLRFPGGLTLAGCGSLLGSDVLLGRGDLASVVPGLGLQVVPLLLIFTHLLLAQFGEALGEITLLGGAGAALFEVEVSLEFAQHLSIRSVPDLDHTVSSRGGDLIGSKVHGDGAERTPMGNLPDFLPGEIPDPEAAVLAGGEKLGPVFAEGRESDHLGRGLPLRRSGCLGQFLRREVKMGAGNDANDTIGASHRELVSFFEKGETEGLGRERDPGRLGGVFQVDAHHRLVVRSAEELLAISGIEQGPHRGVVNLERRQVFRGGEGLDPEVSLAVTGGHPGAVGIARLEAERLELLGQIRHCQRLPRRPRRREPGVARG